MKRYIHIVILALLCSVTGVSIAQKKKLKEAKDAYHKLAYIKTTEILLEVANNGYESEDMFRKLGNSFYFNNKMEDAAKWYGKLMAMDADQDPEFYFRYAQALKGIENYKESDTWMLKFVAKKDSDLRARSFASSKDYLSMIDSISRDIAVKNLGVNTSYSDFGVTQQGDQIVFASSSGGGDVYAWNGQPFLDLYTSTKNENGEYDSIIDLGDKVNTKYHESTATFMPDGKTMYFTRNNYYSNKYKKSDDGINLLKIFKATLNESGEWDDVESVHFNSNDYSVAHPTINSKGTKMYFASDMEGTFGSSDIFEVAIDEEGVLGDPVNLGVQVNTEGNETFPFINSKGDLYFSSNGFNGLGGLDIFVIRDFENRKTLGQDLILENVGKPINSSRDDFGYSENLETRAAFFSSNRDGGKGDDDIYAFQVPKCLQPVKGLVKDKETLELLAGATVTLYDEFGHKLKDMVVGEDGAYEFKDLLCNNDYIVRGEKPDYLTDEKRFTVPYRKKTIEQDLLLERNVQEIAPCEDLAKLLGIPIIYFDFDKWNIRPDAEVELQKVLAVMNKFPTMTIAINSHTDCRGKASYNEKLSGKRAESSRQYLIDKGIDAVRIVSKGYGESKLINACSCEPTNQSSCSEAEHQLNRRSEFIITSVNGVDCDEEEIKSASTTAPAAAAEEELEEKE